MVIKKIKTKKHKSKLLYSESNYNLFFTDYKSLSIEELIEKWIYMFENKTEDAELQHALEDKITNRFIKEIANNKLKTKKEIQTYARMITNKILTRKRDKWYS
jgi:hypothetical protein